MDRTLHRSCSWGHLLGMHTGRKSSHLERSWVDCQAGRRGCFERLALEQLPQDLRRGLRLWVLHYLHLVLLHMPGTRKRRRRSQDKCSVCLHCCLRQVALAPHARARAALQGRCTASWQLRTQKISLPRDRRLAAARERPPHAGNSRQAEDVAGRQSEPTEGAKSPRKWVRKCKSGGGPPRAAAPHGGRWRWRHAGRPARPPAPSAARLHLPTHVRKPMSVKESDVQAAADDLLVHVPAASAHVVMDTCVASA